MWRQQWIQPGFQQVSFILAQINAGNIINIFSQQFDFFSCYFCHHLTIVTISPAITSPIRADIIHQPGIPKGCNYFPAAH